MTFGSTGAGHPSAGLRAADLFKDPMNDIPPTVLNIVPVEIAKRDDADALAEASGRNLAAEWATRASILSGLALCVAVVLAILLSGCGAPLANATIAVNDTRAVLDVAHTTIEERCIPAYQAAKTPDDIAAADKVCLPAKKVYMTTRGAWMAAVAVVLAVRTGGDPKALAPVIGRMVEAVTALAVSLSEVSR